jgi:hypothetical protein
VDRPTEVEFVTDDGELIGADDDVIELGRERPPRWAVVLGCAAVAAGFVTLAATKSHTRPSEPAPRPEAVTTATHAPFRFPGAPLQLGGQPNALQAVIFGNRLYVLRPTEVLVVGVPGGRVLARAALPWPNVILGGAAAQLLLDPDVARLWVVGTGSSESPVLELDAATLRQRRALVEPTVVFGAAALDGHLYLATPYGLADLVPGALHTQTLSAISPAIASVTVDPTRNRLLALTAPAPASVLAVRDGKVIAARRIGSLVNGNVVVSNRQIWLSGTGRYGALLIRLDPATLAPVRADAVQHVGVATLSGGARVLWVSAASDGLWCVDPVTGDTLARWPSATAPVTSRVGDAYVIERGTVRRLALPAGCAG